MNRSEGQPLQSQRLALLQFGMTFQQPISDGLIQVIQASHKKMVRILDENQARVAGNPRNNLLYFFPGAMLVVGTLHDQLWLAAVFQILEAGTIDRDSQAEQLTNARIRTTRLQPDPASKTEATDQEWNLGKLRGEKIDGRLHVASLALPAIVVAGAQACAAKIEPQHRNAKGIQRFCGLIDDLVVQGAAKKRMRVAKHSRKGESFGARGSPQDGFETAGRSVDKKAARIVVNEHK